MYPDEGLFAQKGTISILVFFCDTHTKQLISQHLLRCNNLIKGTHQQRWSLIARLAAATMSEQAKLAGASTTLGASPASPSSAHNLLLGVATFWGYLRATSSHPSWRRHHHLLWTTATAASR